MVPRTSLSDARPAFATSTRTTGPPYDADACHTRQPALGHTPVPARTERHSHSTPGLAHSVAHWASTPGLAHACDGGETLATVPRHLAVPSLSMGELSRVGI